jgi:hypothetical protein
MARKVIGPTGSRRRSWLLLLCLALAATAVAVFVPAAGADSVKTETFQLDGNIAQDATTPVTYDWTNFFDSAGGKLALPSDYTASSFTQDFRTKANGSFDTSDPSTFTVGSKDILDVSGWSCKPSNNVTDKGDIMNAYAAAYTDPNTGHKFFFFALERNANAGDANVAFWFLQGTATCPAAGGSFVGNHHNGDLLIVSAFTNGGSVSVINAYEWSGGANGSLNTTPVATGADCRTPSASNDPICATANNATLTNIPWLTENKSDGVGHTLQSGEFFEGGVDLSAPSVHLADNCFNTFIPDTRSSQSLTATLYDYALGNLGNCTSTTTTLPVDTSANHNPVTTVPIPLAPADAAVTVQDQTTVTVTGIGSFNSSNATNLSWHICGPTDPASSQPCDGSTGNVGVDVGSQAITAGGTYNSPVVTLTEAGRYCFRADFAGDSDAGVPPSSDSSGADECFTITPRTPTISTNAGAGPVDFGLPVTDTANLTGTANEQASDGSGDGSINPTTLGGPAQGTITFTLYKSDCTTKATGTGTNPQTKAVTGNGSYGPVSFTPDAPGLYYWVATYSGDPPNTTASPASNSPCPDANEAVTVRQIPTSVQTKQDWIPNDTATVASSIGNLASGGSVRFRLYSGSTCNGSALYDQTVSVPGGSPSAEVSTTNSGSGAGSLRITTGYTDAKPSTAGPYSWLVEYTPAAADTAHLGSSSACNAENFSTTYNNDPGS